MNENEPENGGRGESGKNVLPSSLPHSPYPTRDTESATMPPRSAPVSIGLHPRRSRVPPSAPAQRSLVTSSRTLRATTKFASTLPPTETLASGQWPSSAPQGLLSWLGKRIPTSANSLFCSCIACPSLRHIFPSSTIQQGLRLALMEHCIQVEISSSSFPRFDRNLNIDED